MAKVLVINKWRNIRDISYLQTADGHHLRAGCLVRGGQLCDITPRDFEVLEGYRFEHVFDFRDKEEIENHPDQMFPSALYHPLSPLHLERPASGEGKKASNEDNLLRMLSEHADGVGYMERFYRALVLEESSRSAYREFFRVLSEKPCEKVYWHCSQGKDRAGLASFYLEYALGVKLEDCVSDYLYSNVAMNRRIRTLSPLVFLKAPLGKKRKALRIINDVFSVKEAYLRGALKIIDESFGGLDSFLAKELEVNLEGLRKSYLVEPR